MIIIREFIKGTEVIYKKLYLDSMNKERLAKTVNVKRVSVRHEGYDYLLIYDSNMKLITDAFRYVNMKHRKQSINTRGGIITALKFLYSYSELFDIDFKSMSKDEALKFKDFLYGLDIEGREVKLETITERTSDTINQYFSVYRGFFKYLGIVNSPFHEKEFVRSTKGNIGMMAHTHEQVLEKYSIQDKSQRQNQKVPMYIKHYEFEKVIGVIRDYYTLREEIIVSLMYTCGMRLGEVLGLTLEDLATSIEDINHMSSNDSGTIIIRNRVSDKDDQLAKTCLIPLEKSDYKSDKYNTEGIGYQIVNPKIILLKKIDKYIEKAHGVMSKVKRKNYLNNAKSDIVSNTNSLVENFYIFLNKNGKPLGKEGWNKILREIYLRSDIVIDNERREHNLSHRFRHGYAMFLVKFMNYNQLELMGALRHKSLSSVSCYFRPDDDDLLEANTRATETMYEMIPGLKE